MVVEHYYLEPVWAMWTSKMLIHRQFKGFDSVLLKCEETEIYVRVKMVYVSQALAFLTRKGHDFNRLLSSQFAVSLQSVNQR